MNNYNLDIFKKRFNLDDLNIGSFKLLFMINKLKQEERKIILSYNEIKEVLKNLLIESEDHLRENFSRIFLLLNLEEFFNIISIDETLYFLNKDYYTRLIFFNTLIERRSNEFYNLLTKNDNLLKSLVESIKRSFLYLPDIDYDTLVDIIKNCERLELIESDNRLLASITSSKEALNLFKEDFEFNTYIILFDRLCHDDKKILLENYHNALYILPNIDVSSILDYELSSDITNLKLFFEELKDNSIVNLRNKLNTLSESNVIINLECKMDNYVNNLINSYDLEKGLFKEQLEYLSGVDKEYDRYICSFNVKRLLKENSLEKVKKDNDRKLSVLIIDYLFKDNIYNVLINLHELLTFNKEIKFLDDDVVLFFNKIFLLDNETLSAREKIDFYYQYKDLDIKTYYYDILRYSKDMLYKMYQDVLVKPTDYKDLYKDGVYDFREQSFYMLVRYMDYPFNENTRVSSRACYSIISNDNTDVFGYSQGFLYGYNSFDIDTVIHLYEGDAFSNDNKSGNNSLYPNRLLTPRQLMLGGTYNEIQLANIKKDGNRIHKKPDYLVVIDKIEEKHYKESKRLNIPIVLIKSHKLSNIDVETYSEEKYMYEYVNEMKRSKF